MLSNSACFSLSLCGAFRLEGPDGQRIVLSSKRGQALIAMLATANGGERTRAWLQSRLWGSRPESQTQASLRRELSNLRQAVNVGGIELIAADHSRVWIDLSRIVCDIRTTEDLPSGEFLEGIDIVGEEEFEDWLRLERERLELARSEKAPAAADSKILSGDFAARPSLVVFPFESSLEDQTVAEGLSEDLIDRLSRLRWLPVISRSSSFAPQMQTLDKRSAGAELGARYVVGGKLQSDGGIKKIAVSLIDAEDGQTLWSHRLSLAQDNTDDHLEEMLTGIAATLGLRIDHAEQQRAIRKLQSDLNVSDLIWKGRWHLNRLTVEDAAEAHRCFDEAMRREPTSPEAIIQATTALMYDMWTQRASEDAIRRLRKMAQSAIFADIEDARGHTLAGVAEIWLRQPLRAEALLTRAIELNPSLVMAHAQLGSALLLRGDLQQAIDRLHFAIRLSPNDSVLFLTLGELGTSHLLDGQVSEALAYAEKSLALRSGYWLAHVVKVNALARMGQSEECLAAIAEMETAVPGFSPTFIDWLPFVDSSKRDFLKEGLNLAARLRD